jgi:hypothetical protein
MARKHVTGALLACLIVVSHAWMQPIWPGPEGKRASDDLETVYRTSAFHATIARAMGDLQSADTDIARAGGEYVAALFAQSFADEQNGRAEWKRSEFWGGGLSSDARSFRAALGKAFGERAAGPEAMPAVRWLLEKERLEENQRAGIDALRRISTPEANALLITLLDGPHPSAYVAANAAEECGRRGLRAALPALERLTLQYRTGLRNAAAASIRVLHSGTPPTYHPETAFTPALEKNLRDITAMVHPTVPADARWCWFERFPPEDNHLFLSPPAFGAWLLEETAKTLTVLDYFGQRRELPRNDFTLEQEPLARAVGRIQALRREDSRRQTDFLSPQGGLTAQFEGTPLCTPEIVVAAWLFERGDHLAAAELLFPRLDELADDRWFCEIARDRLGHVAHQAMLEMFTCRRDYAATLEWAHHLARPAFEGYRYQERAIELAAQLERRTDDFKTLVLPSAEEWQQVRTGLDRETTIRYLADRLRLLNCEQSGQPGGIDYTNAQLRDPPPPAPGPDYYGSAPKVINPYNELRALRLTAADLKLLVPYLESADFILGVSYWRDFHPDRTLHRVRWVVAEIINRTLCGKLVDIDALEACDANERAAMRAAVIKWCDEHPL